MPGEGGLSLLRWSHQHCPGAEWIVLTGHFERLASAPWEQLMRSMVFEPFGLGSRRFGWPAIAAAPHQPWGHIGTPPQLRQHVPGTFWNFDLTTYLAPAGDVSCNVCDLAEYAAAHLRGLRGTDGVLSSASIRRLHTPPEIDAEGNGYASGWVLARTSDGSPEHWHNGSAGSFFAVVSIYPEDDLVIAVVTNYGLAAETPVYRMMEAIRARYVGSG